MAGFLPKLSDKGPEINCPNPKPKKIMVINNWLFFGSITPMASLISVIAGNNASIDKDTNDIKAAMITINSNSDFCLIPIWQK